MPTFFFRIEILRQLPRRAQIDRRVGLSVEVRDVRDGGVPRDVLGRALDELGADAVINRRSTTWRGLDEAEREGDPVALMVAYPALMKRPLIMHEDGTLTVGWDARARATLGIGG